MKVALVYPYHKYSEGESRVSNLIGNLKNRWKNDKFYLQTPLSLLIVASFLDSDITLFIEDENRKFQVEEKYDLILLSFMTCQANRAVEIAVECRGKKIPIGCGGIHPTFASEEMKKYFNFVFVGEMEENFELFLNDFKNGIDDKIYYGNKKNENWMRIPQYDLIDFERVDIVPLQLSRGCPYRCEFCSSSRIFGTHFRKKPLEFVEKELDLITALSKDKKIHILCVDDNLFLDKKYSFRFLELFEKYDFTFSTYSDIKIAKDEELLKKACQAGLKYIFSGLETTNSASIKDVSGMKMRILSKYPEYINKIQSMGIGIFGSFIIGFDGDNEESIEKIKEFLSENMLYRASFGFLTPYPGTPLYDRLKREDRIISNDWSEYTEWNLIIKHPNFTGIELKNKLKELYDFFYSREMGKKRISYFKELWKKE